MANRNIERAVRIALLAAGAAGLGMHAPGALAQDDEIEQVIVTGSRIPQPNIEGTSPVTMVGAQDIAIDLLLIGAGPVTAIPLLLFSLGARMVRLSTMGFLQYIAPTISFLLAVYVWHEPFGPVRAATFALIWAALALVSWEAVANDRRFRARRAVANPD